VAFGKENYKKMKMLYPPKIVLESKGNAEFFIFKIKNKKLSQICIHIQTKGVESQNKPNWILKN